MTKAIRIHETGGPEVLTWEDVDVGDPGDGEVRIRHTAVGLNFIDIYQRSGLYPLPDLPLTLGTEGAGVVEAVGPGVEGIAAGQRVAYAGGQLGSYAEARVMPAGVLVPVPDAVDDRTAAAMMLKGMTAHMLLFKAYAVQAGDHVLVHAAAGGVGSILVQWAKHLGATVIGTVGSAAKGEQARGHGADHVINYNEEDFAERVAEITGGQGVPVVYDSVGKDTFEKSLDCLAEWGFLVNFGNASGPAPDIAPLTLMAKGSLYVNRPTLFNYTNDHARRLAAAGDLFDVVAAGNVSIDINQTYPLSDTAQAHMDLAARKTTGSTVLLP